MIACHSPWTRRAALRAERFFFAARRRSCAPRDGFVLRRVFGVVAAARIIAANFSRQLRRLRFLSGLGWGGRKKSASPGMGRWWWCCRRSLKASGWVGVATTFQRSTALEAALLTFWPPGPPERTKVQENSSWGMR